jgi:CheY-like chemotaxis protein/nitrogen-specific signal transduction histidine kinase
MTTNQPLNNNSSSDQIKELNNKFFEKNRQLECLQNSQSVFLKNLSQNIRIPLNGIIGMIDVLKMTQLSKEQSEYTEIINKYGDNLIVIVNDILDYSKIISNDLELEEKYFQVNRFIKSIDQSNRLRIEGKGLIFSLTIDENIPAQLFGDEYRIRQIISNLINNSVKFTKEGHITISAKLLQHGSAIQKGIVKVRFSVTDSGYGIAETKQNKIRGELQKPTIDTNISTDGIGLGLSISQALLRLLFSQLEFISNEQDGSTFWFDLDMKFKSSPMLMQEASPTYTGKKLSILLVEDNILNQKFAVATLVRQGHLVVVAENGKIAYEKFLAAPFDLILMDVQMPIMDGVQATINIRSHEKTHQVVKPIKIVAVTAYAMDRDRERCLGAGMDKFLAKPFKPDQLLNIINNLDFD